MVIRNEYLFVVMLKYFLQADIFARFYKKRLKDEESRIPFNYFENIIPL